jgi:hypothetical protein
MNHPCAPLLARASQTGIPFLLIERLDPVQLVALLRPLLLQKRIVVAAGTAGARHGSTSVTYSGSSGGSSSGAGS